MNKQLILISLIISCITIFLGCKEDINVLDKASAIYEFPLKAIFFNYNNRSPIYLKGSYFYLSSNEKDKQIVKINKLGQQVLSIGLHSSFFKARFVTNKKDRINNSSITPIFNRFSFDYILTFTVDTNENIYVMNILLPREAKKNGNNNKNIVDTVLTKPYSRVIIKFDKNGKYLYKIGKEGINSSPFTENSIIEKFYSDKHSNLYLVLKDGIEKNKKGFSDNSYHLYRFDTFGKKNLYKSNINQYIPKENGYIGIIEKIEVTPSSEKLIILVRFYKKQIRNLGVKHDYDFKKLYSLVVNDLKVQELRKLDNKEKRYSLLGVTQKDKIYLRAYSTVQLKRTNSPRYNNNLIYNFKILNSSGISIENKSLDIKKEVNNNYNWFILSENEEIVVFSQLDNKIQVHIYS